MEKLRTLLDSLSFPTQKRKNISKEKCQGFVLGYILPRGKGTWKGREPRLSSKSTDPKYTEIYELLKQIAPADDTRVVNQKLEYLIKEMEKNEDRIKDLERRVYKK